MSTIIGRHSRRCLVGLSLNAVFGLRFSACLPLHVVRRISASVLERPEVIDDVAWARSLSRSGRRARVYFAEDARRALELRLMRPRKSRSQLVHQVLRCCGVAELERRCAPASKTAQKFRIGTEASVWRPSPLVNAWGLPRRNAPDVAHYWRLFCAFYSQECVLAWGHQFRFAPSSPLLRSTAFSVSIDTEDRA